MTTTCTKFCIRAIPVKNILKGWNANQFFLWVGWESQKTSHFLSGDKFYKGEGEWKLVAFHLSHLTEHCILMHTSALGMWFSLGIKYDTGLPYNCLRNSPSWLSWNKTTIQCRSTTIFIYLYGTECLLIPYLWWTAGICPRTTGALLLSPSV